MHRLYLLSFMGAFRGIAHARALPRSGGAMGCVKVGQGSPYWRFWHLTAGSGGKERSSVTEVHGNNEAISLLWGAPPTRHRSGCKVALILYEQLSTWLYGIIPVMVPTVVRSQLGWVGGALRGAAWLGGAPHFRQQPLRFSRARQGRFSNASIIFFFILCLLTSR